MDRHEHRLSRRLSILASFDVAQIISYLKVPPFKRTDQMLEYLKSLLLRMRIQIDIQPDYLENCVKELAMHYKLLQKPKNEPIHTNPCDIYIVLHGELSVHSEYINHATLNEGTYIGEPCLLFPKTPSAKVTCSQPTTFAYMSLQTFHSICNRYSHSQLEQSVSHLRQIPIFKGWSQRKMLFLASLFKIVSIDRHNFLFEEGESCEFLYIVKNGEVEFTKSIKIAQVKSVSFGKHGRPISLPEAKLSATKLHCSIKSQLEIIGEEELNSDLNWKYSCRCYSFVCVLYRISKADYKKHMRVDDTKQAWKEKEEIVKTRIQQSMKILGNNRRSSSLPLTNPEAKMKIMKELKVIDPWNMKRNLVLSPRSKTESNCKVLFSAYKFETQQSRRSSINKH